MKIKVITVAGTRPNFVKIAPLIKELERHKEVEQVFVHTGQHYDKQLSKLFFRDLKIPKPDINLEVGSGSHALQTGEVMVRFEKILHQIKPDLVVVVGDVGAKVRDVEVSVAIIVVVADCDALPVVSGVVYPCCVSHIGKCAIAVVAIKNACGGCFQRGARPIATVYEVEVESPIVVVVEERPAGTDCFR